MQLDHKAQAENLFYTSLFNKIKSELHHVYSQLSFPIYKQKHQLVINDLFIKNKLYAIDL